MVVPGYDIIGDVHGQADALVRLLEKLDYTLTEGVYRHTDRIAVFTGDIVDRGPEVRRSLQIVRRMCGAGSALSVLGNHEYNLITYLTRNPEGGWLREHNEKNRGQVLETLDSFKGKESELEEYCSWLKELPLFLDLQGLRVVHACWDHLAVSRFYCSGGRLSPKLLAATASDKHSEIGSALALLLKGEKFDLPDGIAFTDVQGIMRKRKRLKWWVDPREKSYNDLFVLPMYNPTGDVSFLDNVVDFPNGFPAWYSEDEPPVAFGHYWLDGEPEVIRDNVLCVDYGAGAGQKLACYRWSGEEQFTDRNWVWVKV